LSAGDAEARAEDWVDREGVSSTKPLAEASEVSLEAGILAEGEASSKELEAESMRGRLREGVKRRA
jgi:hypothetical protein